MNLKLALSAVSAMLGAVNLGLFLLDFLPSEVIASALFASFVCNTGLTSILGREAPAAPRGP